MGRIDRRQFIKYLGLAGLGAVAPMPGSLRALEPYRGPFYISIAAIGGWDVTSFCDPKLNVSGMPTLNNWANNESVGTAGNIRFAPVANNATFFERFHRDMLVINGIDTQTNSHDDGVRHTWSGRLGIGYPSFGAIAAATIAPELPLSLVHSRGYSETAGITRYSRLESPELIRNLVNDAMVFDGNNTYGLYEAGELSLIAAAHAERLARQRADQALLPRQQSNINALYLANATRGDLDAFASLLPETFETDRDLLAAQMALLAYQSGLSTACQLGITGFDTHQNHDQTHFARLAKLTDLITFLFDTASAAGFADRLVVVVTSDFGRRPLYNPGDGKDHWPIGSALILQQGASWGNRVVGLTDEMQNALRINPQTLQRDDSDSGLVLEPRHLQQALRQLGGIADSPIAQRFPLNAETVDFFNPAVRSI